MPYPRIPNILPKYSCSAASGKRAHDLKEIIANAWTQAQRA
jgi:hypothetical protein